MPDIGAYYRQAIEKIKQEVDSTYEVVALSQDVETWTRNFVDRFGMDPILLDESRQEEIVENGSGGRVFYRLPIIPSDTVRIVVNSRLTASTYALSVGPGSHLYDDEGGWLALECDGTEEGVNRARGHYKNQIQWWNNDIVEQNKTFLGLIQGFIRNRLARIEAKNKGLADVSTRTGIRLRKKSEIADVVPVVVKTKKMITPILKREGAGERPALVPETLEAILHLLDSQGRQFERTPTAFAKQGEEDLRDILLSSLNAVFEGQAVGEAFDVLGKSDIHLRITKGEVFIVECKCWEGPESLRAAHKQLLERLTWHESSGAVILFSKNVKFSETVDSWKATIPGLAGALGSLTKIADNQVGQRFHLPGDAGKEVEVRFLIYNLFTVRPSGRSKV